MDENGEPTPELERIALYLNFDMVASPNFGRFVYDGDGPDEAPPGSGAIEQVFNEYFDSQSLAYLPTPFDGRSDYGPFIAVGVPAGGLFTGAEDIKPAEQVPLFGGTAGVAYDKCYHQACDTLANISWRGLDQMSDAVAHAVWTFAQSTELVDAGAVSDSRQRGRRPARSPARRARWPRASHSGGARAVLDGPGLPGRRPPRQMARIRLLRAACSTSARPSASSTGGT